MMPCSEIQPFVESLSSGGSNGRLLRLGYRIAGSGMPVATLEIPLSVIQDPITQETSITLNPTGTVAVTTEFNDSGAIAMRQEIFPGPACPTNVGSAQSTYGRSWIKRLSSSSGEAGAVNPTSRSLQLI